MKLVRLAEDGVASRSSELAFGNGLFLRNITHARKLFSKGSKCEIIPAPEISTLQWCRPSPERHVSFVVILSGTKRKPKDVRNAKSLNVVV